MLSFYVKTLVALVIITKCQMLADANNYELQIVECQPLLSSCEISTRSPRFVKRAVIAKFSDVFRWRFCLQQSGPSSGLTHAYVIILSDSQG